MECDSKLFVNKNENMCKCMEHRSLNRRKFGSLKSKFCSLEKEQLKVELSTLMRTQQVLDQNVMASKASHDDLVIKDQQLDKQFRSVFMDIVSPTIIDQAYRIFK